MNEVIERPKRTENFRQPKGEFTLRDNLYRRMWYLISDYDYFKVMTSIDIREVIQYPEVLKSNPANIAVTIVKYKQYVEAIEAALNSIPEEYREVVMGHIIHRQVYSEFYFANEKTLKKWVQRFIYFVAENLGEI